jgi:hypothetical protein
MMGFTRSEVEFLIQETIIAEPLPHLMNTLTEYYNGYCFSREGKEPVFNSDMVLYYLDHYQQFHEPPDILLDYNAVSDYGKLERLITFQRAEQNLKILEKIVFEGYTIANLVERYFIGQNFEDEHFKSLLFYLGLLTIKGTDLGFFILQIPNAVMTGLYFDFLMNIISKKADYTSDPEDVSGAVRELAYGNSCEKLMILVVNLLKALSNRDSMGFSEKEIKVAIAAHIKMSKMYFIKSEYEAEKKYADLVLFPRNNNLGLDILLFELKYIKKNDVPDPTSATGRKIISEKLSEAIEQLKIYGSAEDFSGKKVMCWAVVFVGDNCIERVNVPTSR